MLTELLAAQTPPTGGGGPTDLMMAVIGILVGLAALMTAFGGVIKKLADFRLAKSKGQDEVDDGEAPKQLRDSGLEADLAVQTSILGSLTDGVSEALGLLRTINTFADIKMPSETRRLHARLTILNKTLQKNSELAERIIDRQESLLTSHEETRQVITINTEVTRALHMYIASNARLPPVRTIDAESPHQALPPPAPKKGVE